MRLRYRRQAIVKLGVVVITLIIVIPLIVHHFDHPANEEDPAVIKKKLRVSPSLFVTPVNMLHYHCLFMCHTWFIILLYQTSSDHLAYNSSISTYMLNCCSGCMTNWWIFVECHCVLKTYCWADNVWRKCFLFPLLWKIARYQEKKRQQKNIQNVMEKPALPEGGGDVEEMAGPTHGPEAVLKPGVLGNFEPNYPSKSGPGTGTDEEIQWWFLAILFILFLNS